MFDLVLRWTPNYLKLFWGLANAISKWRLRCPRLVTVSQLLITTHAGIMSLLITFTLNISRVLSALDVSVNTVAKENTLLQMIN